MTGTHFVTVGGTRLAYHVAGSGPVMIAHPGGPGVEYSYLRVPQLEKTFTMVYVEPAGTGASDPLPEHATYAGTYADLLHGLVEHLGVPAVHLLGHSHGGVVAQRYALRHPDRVAGLVLYSSTPVTDAAFWAEGARQGAAYPRRHPEIPEAAAAAAALEEPLAEQTEAAKSAWMSAVLPVYFADFWGRRAEFEPLRDGIRSWPVNFDSTAVDFRPGLPEITAPTLVVTGRHDFICGPGWAAMLHDGIARSRLVILPESGHFGHLEEPEAFAAAVRELRDESFRAGVRGAFRRGDTAEVRRLAEEELRRDGEPAGRVEATYALARLALRDGDLSAAEQLASAALDIAVEAGDRGLEERPGHVLAAVARLSGDLELARERYLAGIELNNELNRPEVVNAEFYNLAFVELRRGDVDLARKLFAEVGQRVFANGWRSFVPYLGIAAAALAAADGDHTRAARMIGFTDSAYATIGQVPDPDDAVELGRARDAAVAALGEDRFAFAYADGAVLEPGAAFGLDWSDART
ncbi:alpha/beta fold hydrolase [Actinoplanes philippinensis]|uniref:alpha/beta fold hydrolase n=1 Tax=Actinoplanes philippinensis TaxID=35752 RepID=UPI0033D54A2B